MTTINSNVYAILVSNKSIVSAEDGTTRGKFTGLKATDFSSRDAFTAYKDALAYATAGIVKSFNANSKEDASRFRNNALADLKQAYDIIDHECMLSGYDRPEYGLTVGKKQLRAWIQSGVFQRIKTNYDTGIDSLVGRTESALKKQVEMDIGNILNNRPRLEMTENAKSVEKRIESAEKRKATAETATAETTAA